MKKSVETREFAFNGSEVSITVKADSMIELQVAWKQLYEVLAIAKNVQIKKTK